MTNLFFMPEIKIDYNPEPDPLAMRCYMTYDTSVLRPEPVLFVQPDASIDWIQIYEGQLKRAIGKARRKILRKLRKLRR